MLPVLYTGVIWMVPEAIWVPEPLPPAPPTDVSADADLGASQQATSSNGACTTGPQQRLVFKGYLYEMRVSWQYADTPLSTPWQHDDVDEAERRHRKPAPPLPPPVDAASVELASDLRRESPPATGAGVDPS